MDFSSNYNKKWKLISNTRIQVGVQHMREQPEQDEYESIFLDLHFIHIS